ncbi:MAG TPA: glycogen debranching N-terminal domain-containing protein [Blastocatellia bacterium]|nr:glycogen debranching N-terminal domain-containing protein [Blastocatellia bacterium]
MTRGTALAVVIKNEDIFFLCEPDGSVPLEAGHGFGLYYHDCRYLSGYELRLGGRRAERLVCTADRGFQAVLGLSNPEIKMPNGEVLPRHSLEIKWSRMVSNEHLTLFDEIELNSLTFRPIEFVVSLTFQSAFEDMFAIRGMFQGRRGQLHQPEWEKGRLRFAYDGADQLHRALRVHFSPAPAGVNQTTAFFRVSLQGKERQRIRVSLQMIEAPTSADEKTVPPPPVEQEPIEAALRSAGESWLQQETQVVSDSLIVNRILERSMRDLLMLHSRLGQISYFAAGVPWFVAAFGRDSIITAMQTLAFNRRIAEQTIRLLASLQGRQVNEWREEEPGKILHEIRVGEMARLNEVPHMPYYGTVDATPLFLMLIAEHARWTGSLALFQELRANVEAALGWIARYGDSDGDGYVEYHCRTEKGLSNQGWKDSGDAIVHRDGTLAVPPIALAEVQAYVYQAKRGTAELFRRAGDSARADQLDQEAEELRRRFNRDFWVDAGWFALALQQDKRPVQVLSSNAGHALWTGIADAEKAERTAAAMMTPEMFNGWGVRTLSAGEVYYNPLGYHVGTVWPHDNSLIAAGFKRYGFETEALRIFHGLIEAAMHFDGHRLPELFGGFPRDDYGIPVPYPVACQPQAWAAGTTPYLLTTLLGLEPEGFENRLRVINPALPEHIKHLEIRHLRIGAAQTDLQFERKADRVEVRILRTDGDLDVVIEP